MVLPVLGPVAEVTGLAGERDLVALLLRHVGGGLSRLTLAVDAPPSAVRQEAVFAGTAGVLPVPATDINPVTAFGQAVDQLVAAATGGPPPAAGLALGAEATAVLSAAETAIKERRAVRI